ncbi:MAG: tryptophan 7-halogenase [Armatimonadetes bacterium]|nr:tryptophan 7-halogenase [Armatimonadota bacterium]
MYDAIVLGGGPAGSAAALTLARAGRRVALADRGAGPAFPAGESLPPAARPLLHLLGVMDRFLAGPHRPCYGNQFAWGSDELEEMDFLRDPNGHGWRLDRRAFDTLIRDAAGDAGAVVYHRASISEVARVGAGRWRLAGTCAAGTLEIFAPWLLDCTGRASWLARRQGVKRLRYDRLVGHVALFRHAGEDAADGGDTVTLIEAAPDGWWYTSALPGGGRIVAYLTDAGEPTGRTAAGAAGFAALLGQTRHIRARLSGCGCRLAARPWATAAHTARLERWAGEGWLAAGDAALSFDPLSSQGIFHALASGWEAGRALAAHLSGNEDALREYERSMRSVFAAYLGHCAAFYRQERRWPDSVFWSQRHNDRQFMLERAKTVKDSA